MLIERAWAMPSHKTFSIKPIAQLLEDELGYTFVDPFPYPFKQDAIEYLKPIPSDSVESLAFDPPYSQRQLKEMYDGNGISLENPMNASYWSNCKKEIGRVVKKDGRVMSFGWNSGGIGKKYGFKLNRILLVAHGGQHNDTICTVDIKQ